MSHSNNVIKLGDNNKRFYTAVKAVKLLTENQSDIDSREQDSYSESSLSITVRIEGTPDHLQ